MISSPFPIRINAVLMSEIPVPGALVTSGTASHAAVPSALRLS
ncbi:MAG: hypothetical protein U9Q37_10845 [Euryarchaeota archaeon]|nr:hypothetical protein [Euryarchaeota archaeon]